MIAHIETTAFLSHLHLERGFSPSTVRAYKSAVDALAAWAAGRDLESLDPNDLTQFLVVEKLRLSESGMAARIAGLKSFYTLLESEGRVAANPARDLATPRQWKRIPRSLSRDEIEGLLRGCGDVSPSGLRDQAILEVAYASGLRIAELRSLRVERLSIEERFLTVIGKGRKERMVPLGATAAAALSKYIQDGRPSHAKLRSPGTVFLSTRGNSMPTVCIWRAIKARVKAAGIERNVTPHMLRHSFATHLLQGGADLRVIQELLGHKSINTTERYTDLMTGKLQETHAKFHPRATTTKSPPDSRLDG